MARSRLRPLVACAALAAIAYLLYTCGRGDDAVAPPAPNATSNATPRNAVRPRTRLRTEPSASSSATAPGTSGRTAKSGDVPVDDGYPYVDVEVLNHDGTTAGDAVVYALPAGKQYAGVEPPNLCCDNGRCRLHVLRRGSYDIGAVKEAFAALAQDVEVPHAGLLRIELPAPAEVRVQFEQPLASDGPDWKGVEVRIESARDGVAPYPGRGQHPYWFIRDRLNAATTHWTGTVPARSPCGIDFHGTPALVADPWTFTAPADVRVAPVEYRLRINATLEPEDATFAHAVRIEPKVFIDDAPDPASEWIARIDARKPVGDSDGARATFVCGVAAPQGTIRWSGPGMIVGSTEFRGLRRDVENVVEVAIRIDANQPEPRSQFPDAVLKASVVIDDHAAGKPSKEQVMVWFVADDGSAASTQCDPERIPALVKSGARWALAARGDWTAGATTVDPNAASANVSFVVAPGGYLVLDVDHRLPPSLGDVRLRRRDGLPFPTTDPEGFVGVGLSAVATRGLALGPFPPGEVVFVAEISGEVVGELRATVRAGERTTLKVPSFALR